MSTGATPEVAGPTASDLKLKGFKVYRISGIDNPAHSHGRRDFYKIVLVAGGMTIRYGDQTIEVNETSLILINPHVPHSVVHRKEKKGYACVFTEAFMAGRERTELLQNSPLFRLGSTPIVPLNGEQAMFMTGIYQKMLSVYKSNYDHKDGLIKTCIELIIHEALRIQPPQEGMKQRNAATRITHLFMELLERQFPIESTGAPLRLRTAQDFAGSLSVHVNYLNRSVKHVTGKPTSVHIAERIAAEAKALLQHTDWSVADIADGLGFEYPTYFNNYFKRITGATPKTFREKKV
ncbi:MAG: helix-turn-helix domain-containing protein [Chitinophagaceae bacterium]|nr:helix-turn-helix domain-containing protein [Chitinophagaceae bacterium]